MGAKTGRDEIVAEIVANKGWRTEIQQRCGITRQAIDNWRQVPPERARIVSDVTGYPLHILRPDVFPDPT
ncbi:hypothetical protein BJ122_102230 [Rhodopseudomonas faecalis]|uniref:YdaS antitoxin of YdaST toxin-antitoxin system n=1 Tax=Rhodopseudomonas faecalis TaxID=99655 RepID=A0A318TK37_9BRAD|nr:hypothetical protein [Rhodopseudomonas faecalis]PYF05004.1 hypothetical protein BJ122_102230 [Rhodopseudomonas faecalis]